MSITGHPGFITRLVVTAVVAGILSGTTTAAFADQPDRTISELTGEIRVPVSISARSEATVTLPKIDEYPFALCADGSKISTVGMGKYRDLFGPDACAGTADLIDPVDNTHMTVTESGDGLITLTPYQTTDTTTN